MPVTPAQLKEAMELRRDKLQALRSSASNTRSLLTTMETARDVVANAIASAPTSVVGGTTVVLDPSSIQAEIDALSAAEAAYRAAKATSDADAAEYKALDEDFIAKIEEYVAENGDGPHLIRSGPSLWIVMTDAGSYSVHEVPFSSIAVLT